MNRKQRIIIDILILATLLLILGRTPSVIAYIHTLKIRDEVKVVKNDKGEIEEEAVGEKYEIGYKDIIAKLNIPGTGRTDYITQTTDNDYYLSHDLEKRYDVNGNPFLDSRNSLNDKVLIIYGHNSRRREMPFNYLQSYYDEEFFYEHMYIKLWVEGENRRYKIFSVYTEVSDWSYRDIHFDSDEEYLNHINSLKDKSIHYTWDNKLTKDDEILILQTCSTHDDYLKYEDKFLLIIARRVEND